MIRQRTIFAKSTLIGFFCLCASLSNGQVLIALLFGEKLNTGKMEFGLSGGLNMAGISNLEAGAMRKSLNLGLYFDIRLNDRWSIHPEAVPKFPGGKNKLSPYSLGDPGLDTLFQEGKVSRKIQNIALPLLMRYRIASLLFAEAGPQINLRTKAKDIFESGSLSYENKIEETITRFDFGFSFGVSQKLRKGIGAMAIGARYYIGLTDMDKLKNGTQTNQIFQALLSIPIGAGKSKKSNGN